MRGVYERTGDFIPRPARASDYGLWIAETWRWQRLGTWTSRDPVERWAGYTSYGLHAFKAALDDWWANEVRPRAPGAYAIAAPELHRDRRTPHAHAVIGGLPSDFDGRAVWRAWKEREGVGGRNRVESINETAAAAAYVSKYVLKGHGILWTYGGLEDAKRT